MAAQPRLRRSHPDLARLPIAFDPTALSVIEGLRAALSTAVLIAASAWLHRPELVWSALAALFACLCDIGGPIRRRVPALLAFGVLGAAVVGLGGLARHAGIVLALPDGVLLVFCGAYARVHGPQAQQVGMFLAVMAVLSLDRGLPDLHAAGLLSGLFLGGALWATLLTLVLWRIHPFQPVRRALSRAYAALSVMTQDLQQLLARETAVLADWEAHARAHRGGVRDAIELARTAILDTARSRGPLGQRGAQSLLRLETADQMFGALIALSELLETAGAADRSAAAHMIRRLRPLLLVLGHEMLADRTDAHVQIARSIAAMSRDIAVLPEANRLRGLAELIIARLRVVLTVANIADIPATAGPAGTSVRLWQAWTAPLKDNLSWQSMAFRHALRAAVTAAPALAFTLLHAGPYDHWVTITIVVTMQPYFGNTFARALERAGGTTLGGLIAAVLGLFVTTPLAISVAIFPLAVVAFMVRAVSFGLFVSGLTPMIVLLVELGQPGTSDFVIALERVGLTVAGGTLAVLACWLLWPSWEPNRLPAELRRAIAAHGRYAEAEMSLILGEVETSHVEQARRNAGLATNNVEAAVARALLEPGSARNSRLEAAMVIDAALRRMAGRLAAMQFDPLQAQALSPAQWRAWKTWLAGAIDGLLAGETTLAAPPALIETPHTEALGRIARQVSLIAGTIARVGE